MVHDVFIRRENTDEYRDNIQNILKKRPVSGDVGIEIEMEADNRLPKGDDEEEGPEIGTYWRYHHDGSLRGADNAEYVLCAPIPFNSVPAAANELFTILSDYGTIINQSNRTSLHVHLNVQKLYLDQLCSLVSLLFCVEEILIAFSGPHRVGNLFCLSANDAPAIANDFKTFFQENGHYKFSDNLHYANINPHSISKFGSLEIRCMRGPDSPELVIQWVSILERLYNLSKTYSDPRKVVQGLSTMGGVAFLRNIFDTFYEPIRDSIGWTDAQMRDAAYRGVRIAQDIAYCKDWVAYIQNPETPAKSRKIGRKPEDELLESLVLMTNNFSTVSNNSVTSQGDGLFYPELAPGA